MLTPQELIAIAEFIQELEALIEADDGTCFCMKHIDQLEDIKKMIHGELDGKPTHLDF